MSTNESLAVTFRKVFPEYAKRMDSAKNEDELWKVYHEIVGEARDQYRQELQKCNAAESDDGESYAEILLTADKYRKIVNASGDGIRKELEALMQTLYQLKDCHPEKSEVAAQMIAAGLAAVTATAIPIVISALMAEDDLEAAVILGLTVVDLSIIAAAIALIVLCVVIPIIYLMAKPAIGVILLVNDLDEVLSSHSEYFAHGYATGSTRHLSKRSTVNGRDYVSVGFFTGSKYTAALIGVQGAFTVRSERGTNFTFGFDCPLTSVSADNNCYCAINEKPERVAQFTDEHNVQEWRDERNGYGLNIRCNSPSGSVAYYIARAYKK